MRYIKFLINKIRLAKNNLVLCLEMRRILQSFHFILLFIPRKNRQYQAEKKKKKKGKSTPETNTGVDFGHIIKKF